MWFLFALIILDICDFRVTDRAFLLPLSFLTPGGGEIHFAKQILIVDLDILEYILFSFDFGGNDEFPLLVDLTISHYINIIIRCTLICNKIVKNIAQKYPKFIEQWLLPIIFIKDHNPLKMIKSNSNNILQQDQLLYEWSANSNAPHRRSQGYRN